MEEKVDRILLLLEDPNIGVCGRLKKMETCVYGNGKPGLAEQVRIVSRNWAIAFAIVSLASPFLYDYVFNKHDNSNNRRIIKEILLYVKSK